MNTQKAGCWRCHFSEHATYSVGPREILMCRRFPPTSVDGQGLPVGNITLPLNWCGEFQPKQPEPEEPQ